MMVQGNGQNGQRFARTYVNSNGRSQQLLLSGRHVGDIGACDVTGYDSIGWSKVLRQSSMQSRRNGFKRQHEG